MLCRSVSSGILKNTVGKKTPSPLTIFFLSGIILLIVSIFWKPFVPAFLEATAAFFVALTLPLQIRRYQREQNNPKMSLLNLYPVLGYAMLFIGMVSLTLFRLPALDIVILRQFTLEYSNVWIYGQLLSFLGLLFLFRWAWTFIRVRPFLRTYIVFLEIAIVVASLGSLVFTTLIFGIVERNNLDLMTQGVKTEDLVLQDRANTALLVARTIGNDNQVLRDIGQHNLEGVRKEIESYISNSNADVIRIYDQQGKILISPSDIREEGQNSQNDNFLNYVLTNHKQYRTFDVHPGVLSSEVMTRALYPILDSKETTLGVVEVDYVFDNAFVDFLKNKTGLDTTIYAGKKRSATTIYTLDNVSRWVGSEETEQQVIGQVLNEGKIFSSAINLLGRPYYSAFDVIRNVNGDKIGMISVGTPTSALFEQTRQQLITTFLIVMLISLLVALVGYLAIRNFERK